MKIPLTNKKIELINNWQSAWKLWSMRILLVLTVLPQATHLLETETMPVWMSSVISFLSFIGMVARLVQQGRPTPTEPPA